MSETSSEASSRDSKEGMIPEEEEHGDRDAGTAPADGELSRGLLTDNQASSLRDRGESNEDSDSSAVSSDEDSRHGQHEFDPVTEYMIKHGRKDAHLKAAWDFYAKFTLPTYVRSETENSNGREYRLQEPGEPGGQFYNTWKTPLKQLGDFGLGIGLYFETLAVMGVVFLLAGLANTWTILYFRSDEYSDGQDKVGEQISKGSAACTLRSVVCLDRTCEEWSQLHRPCQISLIAGITDFLTIVVLFFVVLALGKVQNAWAKKLDVAEQTAEDYSILVEDPDPTDTRPGTWRQFFGSRFGKVTYVTTAVKNGPLLALCRERFAILENIRVEAEDQEEEDLASDPNAVMSREQWPVSCFKKSLMKFGVATDVVYWHEKLVAISAEIERETGEKLCSKVFVTFENEQSQRKCLKEMTTGFLSSSADRPMPYSKEGLVRDGNVLSVGPAPEPDDVIWENLEYGFGRRLSEFLTRVAMAVVIVSVFALIIYVASESQATAAAAFISIGNVALPKLMTYITAKFGGGEHHHTHSTFQASLMFKIVIAQWMNTAFIIYFIYSIDTAPGENYINQISKILWADAFTQPLVKVLDLPNRFKQYVLAPFAKTQAKMNSYFMGSHVSVAERYASMLKTLFVCLFFSAIFPQGYYVASMAMFMAYWSSKYCLFNRWQRQPPINDSLTIVTRRYLSIALVIHVLVSLQYYAGWPFDKLCPTDQLIEEDFSDVDNVNFTSTAHYNVSSKLPVAGDRVYEWCEQDSPLVWGELPEAWMPDEQLITVWIFSMFGIVSTAVVGIALFGSTIWSSLRQLCAGVYRPVGKASSIGFSEVDQINAYVPEVPYKKSVHPLLACDMGHLNRHHISWTGDFKAYNLCTPSAFPNLSRKERAHQFSRVVHYPTTDENKQDQGKKSSGPRME